MNHYINEYRNSKRLVFYRRFLFCLLMSGVIAIIFTGWILIWNKVPSTIRLRAGTDQILDFGVPVSGELYMEAVEVSGFANTSIASQSIHIDFAKPVTIKTGATNHYIVDLKLFGMFPLKSVNIEVIQDKKVTPVGIPIGIYVKTKGVLVVGIGEFEGENGQKQSPAQYILQSGDYILEINDQEVTGKADLIDKVSHDEGQDMIMRVKRGEEIIYLMIKPAANKNGEYKLGVWVRDNAQGVGTMTYIDESGGFGALGHGINDIDTSTLMNLESGALYHTQIISITRGVNGAPGELTGFIEYNDANILGNITANTPQGIFGICNSSATEAIRFEPMSIALKQDVKKGKAQIICSITGEPQVYNVEIMEIHLENNNVNRGIVLKITDPDLLSLTGGIVQGMSGSPIIQNEKIIGAVTHVLVQDATSGYGIFIENMLTD